MTEEEIAPVIKVCMEIMNRLYTSVGGPQRIDVDYGTYKISCYKIGINIRLDLTWKDK